MKAALCQYLILCEKYWKNKAPHQFNKQAPLKRESIDQLTDFVCRKVYPLPTRAAAMQISEARNALLNIMPPPSQPEHLTARACFVELIQLTAYNLSHHDRATNITV